MTKKCTTCGAELRNNAYGSKCEDCWVGNSPGRGIEIGVSCRSDGLRRQRWGEDRHHRKLSDKPES
jgi:hypothetical protein